MNRCRSDSSAQRSLLSIPRTITWCRAPGASRRACRGMNRSYTSDRGDVNTIHTGKQRPPNCPFAFLSHVAKGHMMDSFIGGLAEMGILCRHDPNAFTYE